MIEGASQRARLQAHMSHVLEAVKKEQGNMTLAANRLRVLLTALHGGLGS